MKIRLLSQTAVLSTIFVLPLTTANNAAAAGRCEAQVNQSLASMSIPQSDVKSMKVKSRSRGGKSPTNSALDAWVRLNSCSGYVMVAMTRHCVIQQSYTTGDCRVDKLSNY